MAVRVLDRAERRVKLASLAFRRGRRRSERMLDAGLLRAQTQVRCVVTAVSEQAKTWRERSSQLAARWGAAAAPSRTQRGGPSPRCRRALDAGSGARPRGCAKRFLGSLRREIASTRMKASYRIEVTTPLSRHIGFAGVGLAGLLVALPAFAGRGLLQDLFFVLTMLALAQYWNLLAGYAGWSRSASRPSSGSARYCLFALTIAGFDPLVAILLGGLVAGRPRPADRARRLPPARRLFRHRHLGRGRGLPAGAGAGQVARRRHRHLAAGPRSPTTMAGLELVKRLFDVRTPAARDIVDLLAGARARRRHDRCGLSPPALAPRPGARRDPRLRGRRRERRRRRLPHQALGLRA